MPHAGCRSARNRTIDTERIIAREKAAFDAWRRKDKAFYDEYWADDMTEFLPDRATLLRKAEQMRDFDEMTDKWILGPLDIIDPEVRFFGDVALLTYREQVSGRAEGQPTNYAGKVTMIYVLQHGTWRGVHYHESKVNGQ